MPTKSDTTVLSQSQEVALAALIRGASVTEAAAEARVTRQTVSGWRNHDAGFAAALNRGRYGIWTQIEDRLRVVHLRALEVIEEGLVGSNREAVAVDIMKILARMDLAPRGATSAREIAAAEREIEFDLRLQECTVFSSARQGGEHP